MQRGIGEDGEDVFEEDTRGREVGELAQGRTQSYLKTGEFGGAGGMGGGLSGDLGGGGIGSGGLGHDEERGKKKKIKERRGRKGGRGEEALIKKAERGDLSRAAVVLVVVRNEEIDKRV